MGGRAVRGRDIFLVSVSMDNESSARWGVVLSIISAAFTSTGLCLQKIHQKKMRTSPDPGLAYTDTKYVAGISYVVLGLLLQIPITVMLPQVTIAILSAQTVLYSTLLEFLFLKNQVSVLTIVCMVAIALGLIIGVNGSTISDDDYSMSDIVGLLTSYHAIAFVVVGAGLFVGIAELAKAQIIEPNLTGRLIYTGIIAGLVAGLFGSFSKAFLEVVYFNTYLSNSKTYSYMAWVLLIPAIALGVAKMKAVSEALKEFPAYRFLPIYQSLAIFMNAVCGVVFLNEWENMHRLHNGHTTMAYFIAGLLLVCGGVGSMVLKHSDYQELSTVDSEGQGQSFAPMASSDSDDEDGAEYEEYHISGGLNNLVPGGVGQYYGVMFGRTEEQTGILQDPNAPFAAPERKPRGDPRAIFTGSMANVGKSSSSGSYGGSGSTNLSAIPNFHRLSDQAEL